MSQITSSQIKTLYDKYSKFHKDFHLLSLQKLTQGMIRSSRGSFVENFVEELWKDVGILKQRNHTTDKRKHPVKSISGKFKIYKALDRNCYSDNVLKTMIECKSYVDSCYLERADSDSKELYRNGFTIPKVLVALEDSCASEALNYWLENANLQDVFFLVDGKRSAKKPIYKEEFFKELSFDKFEKLFRWMYSL